MPTLPHCITEVSLSLESDRIVVVVVVVVLINNKLYIESFSCPGLARQFSEDVRTVTEYPTRAVARVSVAPTTTTTTTTPAPGLREEVILDKIKTGIGPLTVCYILCSVF